MPVDDILGTCVMCHRPLAMSQELLLTMRRPAPFCETCWCSYDFVLLRLSYICAAQGIAVARLGSDVAALGSQQM